MKFRSWMVCAVAVLTLCMNAPMLARLARSGFRLATSWRDEYRGTSETVDAARRMASSAKASGKSIAYCRSRNEGLTPIERSRILAMSWETAPFPVRNGLLSETIGTDAIVAAEHEPIIDSELRNNGYCIHDTDAGVNLWCRGDGWLIRARTTGHRHMSEVLSLMAMIAFLMCCYLVWRCEGIAVGLVGLSVVMFVVGGVMGLASTGLSLGMAALVIGCILLWKYRASCCHGHLTLTPFVVTRGGVLVMVALIIVYAPLALSHTFVTPNGLGTVGGRAKLMLMASGINHEFFTLPSHSGMIFNAEAQRRRATSATRRKLS